MRIPLHPFRLILLGTFIVFTFTYCVAIKKTESSFVDSYFGKVKTVTTITYYGQDTSFLSIEDFNVKGQPVRMEYYYNEYAKPKKVNEFKYDTRGHKTQTMEVDEDGDTTIIQHQSSVSENVTTLTAADKKLDPEIPLKAKTRISGTIKSRSSIRKSLLYLDKNDYPIASHDYDEGGRLVEKRIMVNDSRGNQLNTTKFLQDSMVYSITKTFDRYSNVITYHRVDAGKIRETKKFYRYEYDKHHNWMNKYSVGGDSEILIEKQIIEYYK